VLETPPSIGRVAVTMRMNRRRATVAAIGILGVAGAVAPTLATASAGTAPRFSAPLELKGWAGGEPSIALDPSNPNNVYVVAPQAVPAALNPIFGFPAGGQGVGFWASHDGARSFPIRLNIGSSTGGGDSDVEVGSDGTVYVADLEATAADICVSTDHGRSFTSGNAVKAVDQCGAVTTNQQGPENDRQWLNVGRGQHDAVYLTYHDFAGGFPIIERSDDHAATFAPCGTILDPTSAAGRNYTPTGGTLVAKPVLDHSGRMFVEVSEPPSTASPVGAALNSLYIAVADRGCSGGTVFKNYTIYSNPGANLANIFDSVSVDGAGNVYVIAAGRTNAAQKTVNVWMFVSRDHGVHWSQPIRVNTPNLSANVMPAIVGGRSAGEVAVGWFGTSTNADPNYQKDQWRYFVATSFNYGRSFAQTTVTPRPIHYGDICTQGVFCGLIPGQPSNRNLADFDELTIDPRTGNLIVAFPGDPYNRPDINGRNNFSSSAYIVRQIGGRPLR
jgi:hypothetical protein